MDRALRSARGRAGDITSGLCKAILALVALTASALVAAQGYELAGKWYTMKWPPGSWSGKHSLPNVYCLTFPSASSAVELGHGFFKGGGIYLTQVLYSDQAAAYIVASTIPAGRSAEDELNRLRSNERQAEAAYGVSYNITENQSAFGTTINLRIKNVAPQGGKAPPFPLARPMISSARSPIETLSVHRLFVRGPDRFEVATFQFAPNPAGENAEAEMTERLTGLADQLVKSLQECTATIPVRIPK
jgi:hypothetical protein